MKSVFEKYSILVPKSRCGNKNSFEDWDDIVQLFREKSIIYESVRNFFHKFEDNWDNINKIATSDLRNELQKLDIQDIEEIFNFWKKINKKLDIINPIIQKLKILEINHGMTFISTNFRKLENFYINLCPEHYKLGFWSFYSCMHASNKILYSKEQFDIIIKEQDKKFKKDINSENWNLELYFINQDDESVKYIFSVEYKNDEITKIKSDIGQYNIHEPLHKNDECNCYSKETLSKEEKIELDKVSFGLICLTELLKINIIEFIPFLKNTKKSECHRIKYLRSELESLV